MFESSPSVGSSPSRRRINALSDVNSRQRRWNLWGKFLLVRWHVELFLTYFIKIPSRRWICWYQRLRGVFERVDRNRERELKLVSTGWMWLVEGCCQLTIDLTILIVDQGPSWIVNKVKNFALMQNSITPYPTKTTYRWYASLSASRESCRKESTLFPPTNTLLYPSINHRKRHR